eukprot:m.1515197 g.1515197  ORF g.1515197 m.1515197 type:complete len:434 (-) comp25216_c0_seq3:5680-6981(-)
MRGHSTLTAVVTSILLFVVFGNHGIHAKPTCGEQERKYITQGNPMAYTTIFFGLISVVACMSVIVVVIAYKKDLYYLRERIILGIMCANVVYSASNLSPAHVANPNTCEYALSLEEAAWTRSVWIWGKYWMVCYEIMIVATSMVALKFGLSALPKRIELLAHILCFTSGLMAFILFATKMIPNNTRSDSLFEEYIGGYHVYVLIDNNSTVRDREFREKLTPLFNSYTNYLTWMIRMWLVPLGVALILWLVSRYMYHRLVRFSNGAFANAQTEWEKELWSVSVRTRLFVLQMEAYKEIVRPLEPYVIAFVIFAIPAVVMSTDYCIDRLDKFEYCQVPCEMILALRSFATACIYFRTSENYSQLRDGPKLWNKFRYRICCGSSSHRDAPGNGNSAKGPKSVEFATDLEVCLLEDVSGNETLADGSRVGAPTVYHG